MRIHALVIASLGTLVSNLMIAAEPGVAPVDKPHAVPLAGTLFTSDVERARIEAAQRRPKGEMQSLSPADDRYQIQGWIQRGNGDTTVWVDGQMIGPVLSPVAAKVGASNVGGPIGPSISIHQQVSVRAESAATAKPVSRTKKRKAARAP